MTPAEARQVADNYGKNIYQELVVPSIRDAASRGLYSVRIYKELVENHEQTVESELLKNGYKVENVAESSFNPAHFYVSW